MIRPAACDLFPVLACLLGLNNEVFVRLPVGGGAVVSSPDGEEGYTFPEGKPAGNTEVEEHGN
jgi:hypothetical protein